MTAVLARVHVGQVQQGVLVRRRMGAVGCFVWGAAVCVVGQVQQGVSVRRRMGAVGCFVWGALVCIVAGGARGRGACLLSCCAFG